MPGRLRIVLAMWPGLERSFGASARARIAAVGDVLDDVPLDRFGGDRAAELLGRCDVLLGHWGCPALDAAAVALAPDLQLFAYAAGSLKEIVTPAVWDAGILVTSGAAGNAVPVAEYTLAAILLAGKGAFVAREKMRDASVDARMPRVPGNWGRRIGIVGASHVGRALIELLRPFHLEVCVTDPFLSPGEAATLGVALVGLDELIRTSDVVSMHVPSLPSTRHMIGAAELAAMKDGCVFVNTARGAIVDEEALLKELSSGRISAVLDVTDPEPPVEGSALYTLPNVFLTPHLAGSQGPELARLSELAVDEIERFARGDEPRHAVTAADLGRIA